jgi:hypothetical protein
MKLLYVENYEKETKKCKYIERPLRFQLGRISTDSVQIPMVFFHQDRKVCREPQMTYIVKAIDPKPTKLLASHYLISKYIIKLE